MLAPLSLQCLGRSGRLHLLCIVGMPLRTLLRTEPGNAVRAAALCAVHAWVVATLYLAFPAFLHQYGALSLASAERIALACAALGSVLFPCAGWLADRIGAARVCRALLVLLALAAVPGYLWFPSHGVLPLALLGGIGGLFIGAYLALLPRLFSPAVRSSGLALGYDGAFAIVGGLGPFAMLWLAGKHGPVAVGIALAAISALAVLALPRERVERAAGPMPE